MKNLLAIISIIIGINTSFAQTNKPILINSSLVSAQNRRRLYWTNIPNIEQPEDRGIKLVDILEDIDMVNPSAVRGRRLNKATILGRRLNDNGKREDNNKTIPITQCLEVRATNTDKSRENTVERAYAIIKKAFLGTYNHLRKLIKFIEYLEF